MLALPPKRKEGRKQGPSVRRAFRIEMARPVSKVVVGLCYSSLKRLILQPNMPFLSGKMGTRQTDGFEGNVWSCMGAYEGSAPFE